MAFFNFGKKTASPPSSSVSGVPTDKVLAMRQQGISNNQIIQTLQSQGHDPSAIFEALNQADLKGNIETMAPPEPLAQPMNPMQFDMPPEAPSPPPQFSQPSLNADYSFISKPEMPPPVSPPAPPPVPPPISSPVPSQASSPLPIPQQEPMPLPAYQQPGLDRIEEIAEAIIDEKWNEIAKSINKIIDWKERTEAKINKLEQRFDDLRIEFDNLNKGVLGKIGEYDKNLVNIGVEIKAMERVFQKVLPTFTENVHTLDRVSKEIQAALKK
ncbi:MAG: hypothetical protein QXK37_02570 [Candidatus Woesearchaeota archaeon]